MQSSFCILLVSTGLVMACASSPQPKDAPRAVAAPLDFSADPVEPFALSGVMTCEGTPYRIDLAIEDAGPRSQGEYRDPCRSGSGPCNEQYALDFANSRHVRASMVLRDQTTAQLVYERSDLKGTVLFWWPGRAEGTVWGATRTTDTPMQPHLTTLLRGVVIPRKDGRALTSEIDITEYNHRDTGQRKISSILSSPLCSISDLVRVEER